MRIYVPATVHLLGEWYAAGAVASTEEGFVPPDDSEEGEYAALMSAADASAALLRGPGRRIVVVVDTATEDRVPLRDVVAVHADVEDRPVDADPDEDLGWFAVQEIPDLL
ncbi:hypothetical protein AB3X52_08030 [Nocardioides sp. DS6]|uniref:Uncharacterized protein n=1 Tax=Nocardioides eburneus TaxID=3231482 RepID=A0ABV3SYV2_9ACTN